MTPSTVIDECNSTYKLEEVRSLHRSDLYDGKVIVVVEGSDDVKAYSPFFNDNCVVHPLGNSLFVKETSLLLPTDDELKSWVFGIKDSDFDNLKGIDNSSYPNLFVTDTHDFETMTISNDTCRRVCIETTGHNIPDIQANIYKYLKPYSYLRYYNDVMVLTTPELDGLCFEDFKFNVVTPKMTFESNEFWLNALGSHCNNAQKNSFPTITQFQEFISSHTVDDCDMLQFLNGHDFMDAMKFFSDMASHLKKTRSYKLSEFHSLFRMCYSIQMFQSTRLYASIDNWGKSNARNLWAA